MQILTKFVKYIRVFISQNPEKLLETIQLHKISVGVINDLKKAVSNSHIRVMVVVVEVVKIRLLTSSWAKRT